MSKDKRNPVVAQTATLYVKDPVTGEWLKLAGLTNFNGPQVSINEVDATDLSDEAMRYVPGLPDYGSFTATAQVLFGDPAQWLITQSLANTPPDTFDLRLVIPDDGYGNGEVNGYGQGFCNSFPIEGSVGALITGNLSFRLTGPWTWVRPETFDKKLRYSVTTLNVASSAGGLVAATINVSLEGDTFDGTNGDDLPGITFSGVPAGLTAVCLQSSKSVAKISFTGAADDYTSGLSDTIQVVFGDSAFTNGPALEVLNHDQLITINWI